AGKLFLLQAILEPLAVCVAAIAHLSALWLRQRDFFVVKSEHIIVAIVHGILLYAARGGMALKTLVMARAPSVSRYSLLLVMSASTRACCTRASSPSGRVSSRSKYWSMAPGIFSDGKRMMRTFFFR